MAATASVSGWCLNSHVCDASFAAPSLSSAQNPHHRFNKKYKRPVQVRCCGNNNDDRHHHQHQNSSSYSTVAIQCQSGARRRQVLIQTGFLAAAFSFPSIVSVALADTDVLGEILGDFRLYSDEANKFKILIPQDWQVGAGENNGIKSVTGFFPAEPSSSNVTVVITGLGPDFTRLESFGKVDAFAENLVSGLDRSWQRPPGVAAKLIDSKAANGLYYIDYTLQNRGETCRHLFSVLGMANNGYYNRLYTVTGQYVDEDSEKYGAKIEKAVASFRLI